MFTQTALRTCVFVLKRIFCQMQCFDWLPLLRSNAWTILKPTVTETSFFSHLAEAL